MEQGVEPAVHGPNSAILFATNNSLQTKKTR